MTKNVFYYQTLIGKIGIVSDNENIVRVSFGVIPGFQGEIKETAMIKKAFKQLDEFLSGKRTAFDLPIRASGTPFQEKVWKALCEIPYGEICSYKDVAVKIKQPKACRAVGMANNKNPIPIFIPCHRVVGSNGKLVGYAGGLDIKTTLLSVEQG